MAHLYRNRQPDFPSKYERTPRLDDQSLPTRLPNHPCVLKFLNRAPENL